MMNQLPAIIVIAPLVAALLAAMAGWLRRGLCLPLALTGLAVSAASAVALAARVAMTGPVDYHLGGWEPPWGIAYHVDTMNGLVLAVVAVCALVNLVSAAPQVRDWPVHKTGAFYSLYLLSVVGLLGMTITGDAFNLYVLLEISSLSGYALVAMGGGRAPHSALNYLLLGSIGASFYLLGVGFLYALTGTLNMADLAGRLPGLYGSPSLYAAFVMIMTGLWLKAAFFPLHGWLPGAYSQAPAPVSGLLAPLMTKVMIYVMLRLMLGVFTPAYTFDLTGLGHVVVWLAVGAIVFGAVMALAAKDLKRMLTYIIVSEVGYMVGGAWLGNAAGLTGAMLHLVNDAVMTLCLFLAVAALARGAGGTAIGDLKGLFRTMPFSMTALVAGGLSIIGVPPFCGFFSKWYLVSAGIQAGHWGFVAALIISSLTAVVLFFRVFETALFEPFAQGEGHGHGEAQAEGHGDAHGDALVLQEAPLAMVAPAVLAALGVVALGLMTSGLVTGFILPALPAGMG